MEIAILLTTTVFTQRHISWLQQRNSSERLNMYQNIISKWLDNTKLNIVVIENSGHNYPQICEKFNKNPRLEIISFKYNDIPKNDKILLDKYEAKGQHELYSINYAINNSKLIKKSKYVIKITGRYFIPSLEKTIQKLITSNINFIQQSQLWRRMNRCEIIGCHQKYLHQLFNFPAKNNMLEQEYMDRINKLHSNNDILLLPKMKLHQPTKQGVGTLLTEL